MVGTWNFLKNSWFLLICMQEDFWYDWTRISFSNFEQQNLEELVCLPSASNNLLIQFVPRLSLILTLDHLQGFVQSFAIDLKLCSGFCGTWICLDLSQTTFGKLATQCKLAIVLYWSPYTFWNIAMIILCLFSSRA